MWGESSLPFLKINSYIFISFHLLPFLEAVFWVAACHQECRNKECQHLQPPTLYEVSLCPDGSHLSLITPGSGHSVSNPIVMLWTQRPHALTTAWPLLWLQVGRGSDDAFPLHLWPLHRRAAGADQEVSPQPWGTAGRAQPWCLDQKTWLCTPLSCLKVFIVLLWPRMSSLYDQWGGHSHCTKQLGWPSPKSRVQHRDKYRVDTNVISCVFSRNVPPPSFHRESSHF